LIVQDYQPDPDTPLSDRLRGIMGTMEKLES
jgi:hypothetical protein